MADYAIHDTTLIAQADILRKKFRTNDRQDPADYAYKMNLMGLLEEKTQASASVCAFEDGADDVPTKSLVVTIPPTLTGVSSVSETQTGRNLLNANGSSYTFQVGDNYRYNCGTVSLKKGVTYTFSALQEDALTSNTRNTLAIGVNEVYTYESATGTNYHNQSGVHSMQYTPSEDCEAVFLVWVHTPSNAVTYSDFMLEYGSTAHAYEPYTAPTTYTASLGRTIYGGTADIVNGEGKNDRLRYDLDENDTWGVYSGADHSFWHNVATGEDRPIDVTKLMESLCNHLTVSSAPIASAPDFTFGIQGGQRIVVTADSSINTLDKFKTWLETHPLEFVVASANPTDFTFDGQEVPTRLGVNNFWSDEGDTEVTYRGQGTITPVLPTLISKSITENGTYSAEDDGADGYDEVTVNVSGGGGGSCERLFYARCVNNDQTEIPAISSLEQGANYSSYLSYDSSTKKFTVLQDFTGVVIGWVYTYQTYESSRSDGSFYVNSTQMLYYTATGNSAGSKGGRYGIYNFKQGDTFWMYTPTRNGYPQQNCKVYLVSDLDDDVFTFADEEA